MQDKLEQEAQAILSRLKQEQDPVLVGRKVLVIDDDVRNIFSISTILEQQGMKTLHAENARDGIALLKSTADVDVVLMDIMMPEMGGLEAIRTIRALRQFQQLPIIAVTAKAMPSDRRKAIDAGASDYIAKPLDKKQLLSLLRVWLHR